MHIYHIYSSYFPVLYQPVVGTFGKFPKWHLFQSKFYSSVGKLQVTIEISISAQLSIKSIFSNIIGIGYWQNFAFGPMLCSNLCFMYCQMGNFYYFPHCLTCWLSKPWHLMKFCYLPTKICHFLNVSKWLSNSIPPSYCLHFSKYKLGILGVKYTVFMQNAL